MGLRDLVARDHLTVFSEVEETVIQWPAGEAGSERNITATFIPEETRLDRQRGEEIVRPAVLWVADSITVTSKDVYKVRGVVYQVVNFDSADYGRTRIDVQRNDKDHTSRPGSGQLL